MKLSEMARKCYRMLWRSFFVVFIIVIMIISFGLIIDIVPGSILLVTLLLFVASAVAFIICVVIFMVTPKKWKKEFLKNHPESASIIFRGLDIIELDGVKPSIVDLNEKHTGLFNVANPTAPPYFRGWLDTDTPFRGFLENDGLALPFTLGARNMNPVHYIAEGEHKAVLSSDFGRNKGKAIEFSFEVFRGRKYEIFYDRENDKYDIKDTSQEKGVFASYI